MNRKRFHFTLKIFLYSFCVLLPVALLLDRVGYVSAQATPSEVTPGKQFYVNELNGQTLSVYSGPDTKAALISKIESWRPVKVTSGPQTVNGQKWWRVLVDFYYGWIPDSVKAGSQDTQSLVPYSDQWLDKATSDLRQTSSADNYIKRGLLYYGLKKYDLAIADYDKAIALDPTSARVYSYRASVEDAKFDYAVEISDINQAIKIAPTVAIYYIQRGQTYLSMSRPDQALVDANQAAKLNPQIATLYITRGTAYSRLGDDASSIENYMQAIKLDPYYANAYFNLGIAKRDEGDFAGAIAYFNQGIDREPTSARGYYLRGSIYSMQQDFDNAKTDLNKAIEIDPTDDSGYMERALVYEQTRDFASALDDFNTALKLAPPDECFACIYYNMGITYADMGDNDQAIIYYTKAIDIDPNYHDAYINRGNAYLRKGDKAASDADYQRASQIH